jgi:hypothetical protein
MNNPEENKQSLSEIMISKIKTGEIKMKPKFYFVLKLLLLLLGVIVLTFLALFLVSFIIFSLRVNGILASPKAGFWGFKILFSSLPWVLILGVILLIATSELFAKHFPFIYRRPVLYSTLGIILIVILGGFIIDRTNLHQNLFSMAKRGELRIVGPMYKDFGLPKLQNVHYGIVEEITEDGFTIETPRDEEIAIIISSNTKLPDNEIEQGEALLILGKRTNHTVKAYEVRPANKDFDFFPDRARPMPQINENLPSVNQPPDNSPAPPNGYQLQIDFE